MKYIFSLLILVLTQNSSASVAVEVDPIAYALKGHSLHLLYDTDSGIRFDIGTFGLTLDEDMEKNDGYESTLTGLGLKVDYYGKSLSGAFIGIQYDKMDIKVTEIDSANSEDVSDEFIGVRFGYNIVFKNFYLSPWFAVSKRIKEREDININNKTYEFENISFFPTLHLGWKFY